MKKRLVATLLGLLMALSVPLLVFAQRQTMEQNEVENETENEVTRSILQSETETTLEWLSVEERLYGLSLIWRRTAEMSPFFAALPDDFDWDALYVQYMSKVINAQDMVEYYETLNRFLNHLGDGKSSVSFPAAYGQSYAFPLAMRFIEGRYIVFAANSNYTDVPLGSEIVYVNETAIGDYLEKNYGDMFSNRTPTVRENRLVNHLTAGPRAKTMTLQAITPDGDVISETIDFLPLTDELMAAFNQLEMLHVSQLGEGATFIENGAAAMVYEGDIHHIVIATFQNPALPEAVKDYIESVADTAQAFILDIRQNGGGASDMVILSQFADPREFKISYAYRQVRDAGVMMLAATLNWAEMNDMQLPDGLWEMTVHGYSAHQGMDMLNSRHLEQLYDIDGMDMWDADFLYEQSLRLFDIPVVILVDYQSASAAESFVIAAQGVNNFTIMGTNTTGMAGDTPGFMLPGGGILNLNTVKQLAPNGQIINNYGLSPDIWVEQTVVDLLEGRDTQLMAALEYLMEQNS